MSNLFQFPLHFFRTGDNFTPPSFPPRAIPQAVNYTPDIADYSRVEITPGKFDVFLRSYKKSFNHITYQHYVITSTLISVNKSIVQIPGLFIRKPSSRNNSQNKTSACANEKPPLGFTSIPDKLNMNDCDEESPKMDAQMTARVDKMLLEYKTSRSKVAASDENVSPNRTRATRAEESETTPDQPPVWAQKIAALRDKLMELE